MFEAPALEVIPLAFPAVTLSFKIQFLIVIPVASSAAATLTVAILIHEFAIIVLVAVLFTVRFLFQ